jgi:maleamate amidohydrolase
MTASLYEAPDSALASVWRTLSAKEREVYRRAGYHRSFGLGARPAVLVVDVEYNFTGLAGDTSLDSLATYPDSCGEAAWRAVPAIAELLGCARRLGVPVIYSHGVGEGAAAAGAPRRGTDVVDELRPQKGDLVVAKEAASAFNGTAVAGFLRDRGVDTVIHTGCTTSGCVRAGVVDAHALGLRSAVVEESVFDRAVLPHQVNLFDMDAKYADVMTLAAVTAYLDELATGGSTTNRTHDEERIGHLG